jgi:xylulokinase
VLSGADGAPEWAAAGQERFTADPTPYVRERYAQARDLTVDQLRP